MKTWVATEEIAVAAGVSARAVRLRGERQGWRSRRRAGSRRGLEWAFDDLPQDLRSRCAASWANETNSTSSETNTRSCQEPPAGAPRVPDHESGGSAAGPGPAETLAYARGEQPRAEARAEIVRAFRTFLVQSRLAVVPASGTFAELYNAGQIEVAPETRRLFPATAGPTVRKWHAAYFKRGPVALADKYGRHRKGKGRIETDDEVRELIVGIIAHRPHANAKQVMRDLRARFKETPERVPGYRTVQRFITNWKAANASVFEAIRDPDAWKSRRRVAFGSASEKVTRLNQLWELDSTLAEVMLQDGRHALVACVDVFSRRAMLLVTRTSRAAAILSLMRRACLAWGVPEVVKTDNGKDYVSAHMARALRGLGVEQETCTPFSPEQKPHVERFIGTVVRGLFEQLPGYIGHNVADRKAIEARRSFAERFGDGDRMVGAMPLTAAELQAACDDWIAGVYEQERHGGLNGRSPFETAAAWSGAVRKVADERALDVLLAEAPGTHGIRTVQKKGIAVEGTYFIAPELGACDDGKKVHVRLDPLDMGRVYVFDADSSEFICVAVAPERTGDSREELAREAKQRQKAKLAAAKKEVESVKRRARPHDLYKEGLAAAREDAGRVAAFPRPVEPHETPAINEASKAVSPRQPEPGVITADTLTDEDRAWADAEFARIEARNASGGNIVAFPSAPDSSEAGVPADTDPASLSDSDYLRWALARAGALSSSQWDEARRLLSDKGMRYVLDIDTEEAGLARLGPRPQEQRKELP